MNDTDTIDGPALLDLAPNLVHRSKRHRLVAFVLEIECSSALGVVARNNTKGRRTLYLEYEGYEPMALRTMNQIGREVQERWPINRIGIIHRLGRIEITESSVVIVVTSAHRRVAF